jgi:hypothetical protein
MLATISFLHKMFLLKFAKDRRRWMYWLFEAKKRFGLTILGYMEALDLRHPELLQRQGKHL